MKPTVPRHPALTFLMPYLGVVKEPENEVEELLEYIESVLIFDGVVA